MAFFGPISSLYDFLTFAIMLRVFDAGPTCSAPAGSSSRSPRRRSSSSSSAPAACPSSRAGPAGPCSSPPSAAPPLGVAIPYIGPLAQLFGFQPLPLSFLAVLAVMIVTYLALAQIGVALFFHQQGGRSLARPSAAASDASPAPPHAGTSGTHHGVDTTENATHDPLKLVSADRQ